MSSWTSTDVEHFDQMVLEAARVLHPGGRFLFYGVHPCFNGLHVESGDGNTRVIHRPFDSWPLDRHPSYREARRHVSSPWWGADGIRTKAGGMRYIPLAEFLNAFADAGLRIAHVSEPGDAPVPHAIVMSAVKLN